MSVQREVVSELRATLNGRVIVPEDQDYEPARMVFYGGINRRPQAIVRAADPDDVAAVISLARQAGQELAVRGGGHSFAGHSLSDGGIVLDLRELQSLQIDPQRRTAWAEGGLTAGAYTKAVGELRLATGFGDTGSVGIGGLTLGGGVGFLVRKHGLTIDQLLAAEVVTADGQLLRADAETNPDLFWALRGGGGNFGVVTRFQFRLHEVPSIVGGMLILPATPAVIAGFIAAAEAAPDELSTIANIMPAPPMPMVPAEQHGQLVVFALLVYAGEVDAGERALAPFRKLAAPIVDMLRPMTYPEVFVPEEGEYHPTAVARTMLVDRIDLGVAEEIVSRLEASDAPVRVAQLRVLGGAMARVPAEATAYAHRASRIMVNLAAFYESPAERVAREAWVSDFAASLHQGDSGVYVNFLGDASEAQVRTAYPGSTWDRLAAVKRRYDPTNLLRVNHNIPPASSKA
ncbi:MAG TPA: FAD-binding oxidoreductase [Anaerolineales bacterium]